MVDDYELVAQANMLALPFPDQDYDAIVSAYVWEHVALADRTRALSELYRVLRPGGRIVFLFDVACHNPLFRWYRRRPERFRASFVERDRHYGLERASDNLRRLREAGFDVVAFHAANKTPLQYPPVYEWGAQLDDWLSLGLAKMFGGLSRYRLTNVAYCSAVTLIDDAVERLLPLDWARLMLFVAQRPLEGVGPAARNRP